ncbi:DKNYY family protein [Mucilaginibacter pineti]|uniref:DKNYY family protein n=1 Tax=Mucilaginibacter pineti TaxID=1391627 RepID=A0A1G7GHU6_9SPHI|nr:DKNYY domain-containing protein [Mucilaginibacter pineti]SDE87696.1 DKNYY family protein [Mucilaginibacter pineti]
MNVSIIKRVGITAVIVFLVFILAFTVFILFAETKGPDSNTIDNTGQKIGGIFVRYQNQVYASVPSNGYYLIKEADANSFRLIDDSYQNHQFGVDKNHAYCGNLVIKDFNPATAKAIGNDYFTDGKQTCYCASLSVRNADLSIFSELSQQSLYGLGIGDKPQTYIYPLTKLEPGSAPYHAILKTEVVTNGTLSYYQGKILPQTHATGLRQISELYNDGDVRESQNYLADGQNVYYKTTRLPIQDHPDLHAIVIDAQNQENYLIDPKQGMVYVNDMPFDKQYSPYHALSLNGGHVYHSLFLSKGGIFYFEKQKKEVLRIKENPFNSGGFKEIAPLIFSDDHQILYTEASQVWGGNKSPGLKSESTHIYRLDEPSTGNWQKIGMVDGNSGSVWKNGNTYYYFDQLGNSQLIPHSIYRITDQATVNALLATQIRTDDIRKLVHTDHLAEVKRTELVEVKTKFSNGYGWAIWILLAAFLAVQLILWILRKLGVNIKPFSIRDQHLKVNSVFGGSYALSDIAMVVFSIETAVEQMGYTGCFRIQTKDGKLSRKYMFATQIKLTGDTRQALELYIADLQNMLKEYQIGSILKNGL